MMEMWILTRYTDVDFVLTHPAMSADRANARNRFAEMQRGPTVKLRLGNASHPAAALVRLNRALYPTIK
jgi:cytochrome P450